jgi:hypothetical protein
MRSNVKEVKPDPCRRFFPCFTQCDKIRPTLECLVEIQKTVEHVYGRRTVEFMFREFERHNITWAKN